MQDNFNIHEWRLNQTLKEMREKQCNECGATMEGKMCNECGYMEEATFTSKHDDNPKLKGGQKDLPDELQAGILKKEGKEDILGDWILDMLKSGKSKEEVLQILKQIVIDASNDKELNEVVRTSPLSDLYDLVEELVAQGITKDEILRIVNFATAKLSEGMDHEVSMAQNSLKSIMSSASKLMTMLGNDERDIPGWIQDHITNAENYIDQAAQGFHELDNIYEED